MPQPPPGPSRSDARRAPRRTPVSAGFGAAGAILLLLALFAGLSWSAARGKCPTFDEPQNAVGAWMIANEADWRAHPDHPALWQYWMALPNGPQALRPDRSPPRWEAMLHVPWIRVLWTADMLFRTSGVDAEAFVGRSRAMMLCIAVLLGGLVALWAWRLAGPVAALVATGFFAFDPTLLAHAPLVKNDVALAFATLLLMYALWRLGRRATFLRAAGAALAFAVGFGVKFSALAFIPLAALALTARALVPAPWEVLGRTLSGRGARLAAGGLLFGLFLVTAWGVVWASCRFRFAPAPDPEVRLDTGELLDRMSRASLEVEEFERAGGKGMAPVIPAANPAWRPGHFLRAVLWAERHRVMPQAWLYGIVYSEFGLERREGFLMGEKRLTGWWYYMPLAALFKTPLATLAAAIAAAIAAVLLLRRGLRPSRSGEVPWSALCLLLPILVFGAALMASRASLGLRHALPVLPFVLIAVGVAAARARTAAPRASAAVLAVLLTGVAAESLAAYPDFIPFFNAASRPWRLSLLGDSNLDWGQDLKLVAEWRRRNPDRPLYLAWFGQADPAYYGIDCRRFPTVALGEAGTEVPPPGARVVLAVSATHLQGIYVRNPRLADFYADLRRRQPLAILGGSIYLFDWTRGSPVAPEP